MVSFAFNSELFVKVAFNFLLQTMQGLYGFTGGRGDFI